MPHHPPPGTGPSDEELADYVASIYEYSPTPIGFEDGRLYYPDIARGLPMFRIIQTTESTETNASPAAQPYSTTIRDSFGEGVYIEKGRSEGLCSPDCRCHQLQLSDFAFVVSTERASTKIVVPDETLNTTLIDVIGRDNPRPERDPPVSYWDSADLSAKYDDLKERLRAVIAAPVGSIDAKPFLGLRLLVDGFLGQGHEGSPSISRHKDASDVLGDVLPEVCDDMQEVKLLEAAFDGDITTIRDLLAGGVNINAYNAHGNTALIIAAIAGHLDVAQLLVAQHADIAWANNQGETAVYKATEAFHSTLLFFLVTNGANIYAKDNSGRTAACMGAKQLLDLERLVNDDTDETEQDYDMLLAENDQIPDDGPWTRVITHISRSPSKRPLPYFLCPLSGGHEAQSQPQSQPQSQIADPDAAKKAMRHRFMEEYHNVRHHKIFERVQGRFPNPTRAWRFGMVALRSISRGYLPQELGMTMALLCVCRAVSLTLHAYNTYPMGYRSYPEQFKHDLPRWLDLFQGDDRELLRAAAQDIWRVRWDMLHRPSSLDYHDLFQHAERLTSSLVDAAERLFGLPGFAEPDHPEQVQQSLPRQDQPAPNDPDLRDPGPGSTQHRKRTLDGRAISRRPLLWAELLAGAIFSILLIFLLWLCNLSMGTPQLVAISTAGSYIGADAQSVAANLMSCMAEPLETRQPLNMPLPTAMEDVDMPFPTPMGDVAVPLPTTTEDADTPLPMGTEDVDMPSPMPMEDAPMPEQDQDDGYPEESSTSSSTSDGRWKCPEISCKSQFTRQDNLKRHFKNRHGPEPERRKRCKTCKKHYNHQYFGNHKCNLHKSFNRRSTSAG